MTSVHEAEPPGGLPDKDVPGLESEPLAKGFPALISDALQMLVVAAIAVVALDVLVRSVVGFLDHPAQYPESVVGALDGILVVIILLDILRTLTAHYDTPALPVRPFLAIGVLAAVRDILSASAHLALDGRISTAALQTALIQMAVGVGVVVVLVGALILAKRVEADATLVPWHPRGKRTRRGG